MLLKIGQVKHNEEPSLKTGQAIFDEWFSSSGGIVLGSAIYVSGTSGSGKTTLMANIMEWLKDEVSCLYSREMRLSALLKQVPNLSNAVNSVVADVESCPDFDTFLKDIKDLKPKVIIIDSLQVIAKEDYAVKKIKSEEDACYYIIQVLREYIHENNAILFLIGHNTKDGNFAGNNTIIQMMDAHIDMVYDKKENTRTMSWGVKNRKGKMGSIPYFIDNGRILFEQKNQSALYKEKNIDRILKETTDFIEQKIETLKYFENGKEISPERIEKLKKDYYKFKKQHLKYTVNNTSNYFPQVFIEHVFHHYFTLIEHLEYEK